MTAPASITERHPPLRKAVATIARVVLYSLLAFLFWAAAPALIGWTPTTVMSGSMGPAIAAGDVVSAMPVSASALQPGQVLLVEDPDHEGRLRLHRYVKPLDGGTIQLKGDANEQADSTPVPLRDVRGIALVRVPFVGLPIVWAGTGNVGALALVAGAVAGLLLLSRLDRDPPRGGGERGRHSRRSIVTAAAVAGVITIGAGSSAAWSATTANPSSTLSSDGYPCLTPTPTNSPYLSYALNEPGGTSVTDSSGAARTGTTSATGATRIAGSCLVGDSPYLRLDGATGQVLTPATAVSAPQVFTQQLWFRTTTTRGGKLIGFGNSRTGASSAFDRQIYMTTAGKLIFGVYNLGYLTITSPNSYNDGSWHQVNATLSTAGMQLYVDGARVAVNALARSAESNTGYWRIGYDSLSGWPSAPTSAYFAGDIDSVEIYTTALTATQITTDFRSGR